MPNPVILIVDDEVAILHALERLFRREGYRLLTCNHPVKALDFFVDRTIHVVISDYRMPEMTGTELLGRVAEISPDTRRILLSGCSDSNFFINSLRKEDVFRVMLKPWDNEQLKTTLREAVDSIIQTENPLNMCTEDGGGSHVIQQAG